jgi:hypothetical protein
VYRDSMIPGKPFSLRGSFIFAKDSLAPRVDLPG